MAEYCGRQLFKLLLLLLLLKLLLIIILTEDTYHGFKKEFTRTVNQSWITHISTSQSPPLKSGIILLHYTKPSKEQKTVVSVPDEAAGFLLPSAWRGDSGRKGYLVCHGTC